MKYSRRVAVIFLVACLILSACGQDAGNSWQKQYDLGIRYLSEGNYEDAIIAFTAAIEIEPKRPESFVGRGNAYALSGDTEENLFAAQTDYETAIDLDETLVEAWLGLADVCIRRGDYAKVLEVLRKALGKTGNDSSIGDKLAEMESGSFSDSQGNIRQLNTYGTDGVLIWRHDYTYDAQARLATVTSYDGQGNQTGYVELAYDQEGNQTVDFTYLTEIGVVCKVEHIFNEDGQSVEETWYNESGIVDSSIRRQYDENGNLAVEAYYTPKGNLKYISYIECNSQGWVIRQSDYGPNNEQMGYCTYEYDSQGRIICNSYFGPDGGLINYFTYEYDQAGNQSGRAKYDKNGRLTWRAVLHYDEHGNYRRSDHYDGEGNLIQSSINGD